MRFRLHRLLGRICFAAAVSVALVVGTVGVLVAPVAMLAGAILGVMVGVLTAVQARRRSAAATGGPARSGESLGLVIGGAFIAAWAVISGTVLLLGPASPIVIAALVLVGPPTIWRWRRFGVAEHDAPTGTPAPPVAPQPPRPAVDRMSTAELCVAWQNSYWILLDEPDSVARSAMAQVRQSMLDEFERRDTQGFGRWLETGARAGSDPRPYLTPDP